MISAARTRAGISGCGSATGVGCDCGDVAQPASATASKGRATTCHPSLEFPMLTLPLLLPATSGASDEACGQTHPIVTSAWLTRRLSDPLPQGLDRLSPNALPPQT